MMKSSYFCYPLYSFCLVSTLLFKSCIPRVANDITNNICGLEDLRSDFMSCMGNILVNHVWNLHQWSPDVTMELCNISCQSNLKGRVSKLSWHWNARFRCDSIAPGIEGNGGALSRNGAIDDAIGNFIAKALMKGFTKVKDLQCLV